MSITPLSHIHHSLLPLSLLLLPSSSTLLIAPSHPYLPQLPPIRLTISLPSSSPHFPLPSPSFAHFPTPPTYPPRSTNLIAPFPTSDLPTLRLSSTHHPSHSSPPSLHIPSNSPPPIPFLFFLHLCLHLLPFPHLLLMFPRWVAEFIKLHVEFVKFFSGKLWALLIRVYLTYTVGLFLRLFCQNLQNHIKMTSV